MTRNKLIDSINISSFNYELPDEKIAKYPLDKRDQSKLLVYKKGNISESTFFKLPEILESSDLLVFNNTRVIPARLKFQKSTGAAIEIFCLEPVEPPEYVQAFQSTQCTWKCIVGNLKKWKDDELEKSIIDSDKKITLKAKKTGTAQNSQLINFTWDNTSVKFERIIELAGVTPIPPYLNRESEDIDKSRYQTVYSQIKGSVAAPTAGLHFTNEIFDELKKKGISNQELTLHVGAGTFKPVQTEKVTEHEMHTEFFTVSKETLEVLYCNHGKIVAVGTTTLRTLESLYWLGVKLTDTKDTLDSTLTVSQWEPYNLKKNISYKEAIQNLMNYLERNNLRELTAHTQIMIVPGYNIKSIKALITNFHQPKSTLLLLVAALTGENWKNIYQYALLNNFRFLSYGDSSIIYLQ